MHFPSWWYLVVVSPEADVAPNCDKRIVITLLIPLLSPLLQVVHLDNMKHEEEIQKLPLQTPYYDMAATESSPYTDKLVRRSGC